MKDLSFYSTYKLTSHPATVLIETQTLLLTTKSIATEEASHDGPMTKAQQGKGMRPFVTQMGSKVPSEAQTIMSFHRAASHILFFPFLHF